MYPTSPPFEAHNGYIEVYLNLGLIGVCLLVGVLWTGFENDVEENGAVGFSATDQSRASHCGVRHRLLCGLSFLQCDRGDVSGSQLCCSLLSLVLACDPSVDDRDRCRALRPSWGRRHGRDAGLRNDLSNRRRRYHVRSRTRSTLRRVGAAALVSSDSMGPAGRMARGPEALDARSPPRSFSQDVVAPSVITTHQHARATKSAPSKYGRITIVHRHHITGSAPESTDLVNPDSVSSL